MMINLDSPFVIAVISSLIAIVAFMVRGWTSHIGKKIDRVGRLVYSIDRRVIRIEDKLDIPSETQTSNGDY